MVSDNHPKGIVENAPPAVGVPCNGNCNSSVANQTSRRKMDDDDDDELLLK